MSVTLLNRAYSPYKYMYIFSYQLALSHKSETNVFPRFICGEMANEKYK